MIALAAVAGVMVVAGAVVFRVTPLGAISFVAALVAVGGVALGAVTWRGARGRPLGGAAVIGALVAAGLLAWVGANDPTVQWFGHVTTHGDRTANLVAITFDDGPDDPYTLDVARILDDYGVKGTFFQVGKAIDAAPAITRTLLDDGHLLANHSYHHDYWRWLDPRYPELQRTQDAFKGHVGQCPAFFRPPHGQRTPFMLARVSSEGMHAVTWDVSASDWVEVDGALVARNILASVRPGSIVLLHDGLDGNVHADRSVVLTALPLVLDGLLERGLHPVRLDELLGRPGYLDSC
jgi:peptidoglycan-N-acetylglucosamine deacetylase